MSRRSHAFGVNNATMKAITPVAGALIVAAQSATSVARRLARNRREPTRYLGVRPGADTPLWNELVAATLPYLKRRGEKVKLARLLGISRQRLHLLLVAQTACPDAERTLQLMAWLAARQRGISPG